MKHSSSVRGACVSYADFPYASFLLHSGTDTKFEDVLHHFNLWNWGGEAVNGLRQGFIVDDLAAGRGYNEGKTGVNTHDK